MKTFKKTIRIFSLFLAATILFASCSSSTLIQSSPSGAKVYMDGAYKGVTPYTHADTKILGSSTMITLEKEGYATSNYVLTRNERADVGAIIGGVLVYVPFLWTLKYDPTHIYELKPEEQNEGEKIATSENTDKANELRELKKMLDENLITQEDYEIEKQKILSKK